MNRLRFRQRLNPLIPHALSQFQMIVGMLIPKHNHRRGARALLNNSPIRPKTERMGPHNQLNKPIPIQLVLFSLGLQHAAFSVQHVAFILQQPVAIAVIIGQPAEPAVPFGFEAEQQADFSAQHLLSF